MSRFLRNLFFGVALLCLGYAGLFGISLGGSVQSLIHSKIIWGCLAVSVFLIVVGWRFSLRVKFGIFMALLSVIFVEILLQATAWLGILPAVDAKSKAPFGRIYWTSEGHGNDIRNRYAWHYPEFDLKAPKRIAVIGDSFVEAVEVSRNRNEAADLERLLRAQSKDWAVLAFGNHGTCPAHHLDVLDYASRHFTPQEAIVIIYLGNDINENSPVLNYLPPENYVYYDLDRDGRLVLNPASAATRAHFDIGIEIGHRPLLAVLPAIIYSHCMTIQLADSLRDNFLRRRRLPQLAAMDPEAAKYGRIGLSLRPFLANDPEAQHAMAILLAELASLKEKCDAGHITFRLVTVPFFPPQFYATQHGSDWSAEIGGYDFLGPDRQIAAFAGSQNIPFLSFANWLRARKKTAEEIQGLYFTKGSGHFTELGHEQCAQAMLETFYASQQ